jgi:hypothetical protein
MTLIVTSQVIFSHRFITHNQGDDLQRTSKFLSIRIYWMDPKRRSLCGCFIFIVQVHAVQCNQQLSFVIFSHFLTRVSKHQRAAPRNTSLVFNSNAQRSPALRSAAYV